jgi:hypothetical protein
VYCAQTGLQTEPSKICYDSTCYRIRTPSERLELVLLLYNLVHILSNEKDDGTTVAAIQRYNKAIDIYYARFSMKTFDDKHDQSSQNNKCRNEESSDDDEHDARTEDEKIYGMQLRPHGYEVEPGIIVAEDGSRFERLFDVWHPFYEIIHFSLFMHDLLDETISCSYCDSKVKS